MNSSTLEEFTALAVGAIAPASRSSPMWIPIPRIQRAAVSAWPWV